MADRTSLEAEGDPIPDGENFTLYRGVAGKGTAMSIAGVSWTSDLNTAKMFAKSLDYLENPVVFKAIVTRDAVYFYSNTNQKHEYFCIIPRCIKLECVWKG